MGGVTQVTREDTLNLIHTRGVQLVVPPWWVNGLRFDRYAFRCRDAVLFIACWLSALLNAKTCAEVGLDVRREVR